MQYISTIIIVHMQFAYSLKSYSLYLITPHPHYMPLYSMVYQLQFGSELLFWQLLPSPYSASHSWTLLETVSFCDLFFAYQKVFLMLPQTISNVL